MTSRSVLFLEFRRTFFQSTLESNNMLLLAMKKELQGQAHNENAQQQNKYRDIENQRVQWQA